MNMRKMYFTSKKSLVVEQNADGTLLITKTSTMKPLENAGLFIVSQGGINAILAKCKEVSDAKTANSFACATNRQCCAPKKSPLPTTSAMKKNITQCLTVTLWKQRLRISAHCCATSMASTGACGSSLQ